MINSSVFNGIQLEKELEPMHTGKAKGWLGEYHWVSLAVTDDNKYYDINLEPEKWAQEKFGKSGHRWFYKSNKFYFKNEQDMTMFILRWS